MKKVFDYLQYLAVFSASRILSCFPRSIGRLIAPPVSWILFCIPQLGGIARLNVAAAFPEKTKAECNRIARKSLENLILSLLEFFWSSGRQEKLLESVDETEECTATAKAAHASGKPCIFITPHLGSWEVAGMYLAVALKFNLGVVVRTPRNPYLERLIRSGRLVKGTQLIYSKHAVLGMVRALKNGSSLGVLIDQNTRVRNGGAFVNFFGFPVPVSMAPAMLARKGNHYVAVGFVVRNGARYKGVLRPLPRPASGYASDEELTQDIMNIMESFIREYPEQYLWMYKRFQHIPHDIDPELRKRYPAYASEPGEKFYRISAKNQTQK